MLHDEVWQWPPLWGVTTQVVQVKSVMVMVSAHIYTWVMWNMLQGNVCAGW